MAYDIGMEFEWDEAKNSACFERRGFEFGYAVQAFLDPHRIVVKDRRWDYGEDRYRLLGTVDGRVYVLVYTVRGSAVRIISARKANRKEATDMSTTRIRIDPDDPSTLPEGRIDPARVDATTEAEIAAQEREDEEEAMQDVARYARRVRRRLGLSQTELARRIDVPHETIRNWEQGKRCPTGAARALLRVLDKAPETALRVLS